MQLEKVFELIRKEEVVIWVGSGFSLYAGYPNGTKLSEIIYKSLSLSEQNEIYNNLPLMDLTEQYVRLKAGSRNELNTILKKEFNKTPKSIRWHEVLSNIPQIKTIITTNYDHLFEQAYKNEIYPIISQADLAYRDKKVELFKIHGDINYPDSIVISRSDYTNFFANNLLSNLIWTTIKERISNKSILFIGYDYEDENVKVILQEMNNVLGTNRKEIFLVAPDFKQHKIQYLQRFNIQYLNFKGEVFVEKLFESIRENIFSDFNNQYLDAETFRKFCTKNNLQIELKSFENNFKVKSVKNLDKNSDALLAMKFKGDEKRTLGFIDFVEGRKFGKLIVDGSKLQELKLTYNNINVLSSDLNNYRLEIESKPSKEGKLSIVFEDETEFDNVQYRLFSSRELVEVRVNYKNCEIVITIAFLEAMKDAEDASASLKCDIKGNFDNVNDAISVTSLLSKLAANVKFLVYPDDSPKGLSFVVLNFNFHKERLAENLYFFESLKKIQKLYSLRFTNFAEYSKEDIEVVDMVNQFANGGVYYQEWDKELGFDLNRGLSLENIMDLENGHKFFAKAQEKEELKIFNKTIDLGYRVLEFSDLYITNLDQVRSKETSIVYVKSKSKTFKWSYSSNLDN